SEGKLNDRDHECYKHHRAGWFSRITFFWLTPLLWTGYTNPLELEDLGKLPAKESTAEQYSAFMKYYNKYKRPNSVPSLWKCYVHCYWKNFLYSGILKLMGDFVGLVPPLGISVVVDYVAASNDISSQGLIYSKTLKMNSTNKDDGSVSESKTGNATNLISEDSYNIMSCLWIGHYVWAIPLKIGVLMYLLYSKLGISAVIGASCCIAVMTPLQFYIGKTMSDNSKLCANFCDERLRMINEMLQGIRVLKLCAWETKFCSRIIAARNKELRYLDKDALYWALMTFLTDTSSILITVVTLGMYYHLEGSNLSASKVFSALALFNQLTVQLFIFPITVLIIINAIVSTRRLENFLHLPETMVVLTSSCDSSVQSTPKLSKEKKFKEIDQERVFRLGEIVEETDEFGDFENDEKKEDNTTGAKNKYHSAAIIRDAAFSWGLSFLEKPSLYIESVNIPKGKLTVLIGRVGSGKSSFLSALLGEMKCLSGLLKWEKGVTMAYVSQQPWVMNATLRENILFGLPYNQRRFTRVILAAALQRDIEGLPNKDLTELGEKGVNLSGGQRQRIAIARALYSKANVVILDDPLSALDYHVAQHVFEKGIYKLVARQKRTVIMVTHSLHLLTHAHQIIALENGRVRACGRLRDMEIVDGVVTEIQNMGDKGRTARERWQLVKLVSQIGQHIRQQNPKLQTRPLFIPLRKQPSSGSECYWTQDLPLPRKLDGERDFPLQRSTTLPRHRPVARASSLQPHSTNHLQPVTRQASSPTINQGSRSRTYTFEGGPKGGNLLKQIFSMSSTKNVQSGKETPLPSLGSFKEKNILRRLMSSSSIRSTGVTEPERHRIQRLPSTCSDCSEDYFDDDDPLDADWCGTSTSDERQYGKISHKVYLDYWKACGILAALLYLVFAASWQALKVYADFWLRDWTDKSIDQSNNQALYYLIVFTVLSLMCVVVSLLSNILGQYCGATARRRLHKDLLLNVVKLPVSVFDNTPLGRILARFSTDISVIDKKLATSIQRLIQFLSLCFSSILVNSIITPWFLALAVPLCILFYIVQKFYRTSSRELQRLDSMSRTPILSHFTETISGLEIIRAFKQQQRFTDAMYYKMDSHTNAFLITNSANRWLGIALDYLGAVIVLLAMIVSLVCASFKLVTPALVGLAINYTLLVPIYLNWVVKFLADVEMNMAGVERIRQYSDLEHEDYKPDGLVPKGWPKQGEIRFESVSLRYDRTQDVSVSHLTLIIPPGQKVGICGRTGSGKSSLVMSLFGMVPLTEGRILIDGVDMSALPLQALRSRLSVIPQDVIMFSGTIRENLDLESKFTDAKLWECLELAQMKETVIKQLGGLYGPVREGGVNLSNGQRQLLCLARAILHNTACLVMDEATSSLDTTTEKTLLHAAERAFANKTVVTIAHRLGTLLSCDRIIVMESGRIVEDGSPSELLNKSMGIFSTMLRTTEETN
ncbi:hypothetical protein AAG570_000909, partial [Ranatra chinensis]